MTSRGIRDNNPGNIHISTTKWQGKLEPSTDPEFETFSAPEWGIRAIAKIVLTDATQGINTIHTIMAKYAPPIENNTAAYEKAVAEHLKVDIDAVLDVDDYRTMYALVVAIILHENGSQPYSDAIINKGLNLAGIYNVPLAPIHNQPETHLLLASGTLASVTALGQATEAISPAIPIAQQILNYAPWLIYAILFSLGVFLAYKLYKKYTTGV